MRTRHGPRCVVIWLLVCSGVVAAEPPGEAPPAGAAPVAPLVGDEVPTDGVPPTSSVPPPSGVVEDGTIDDGSLLRLSLADTLRMALEANLTLKGEAFNAPIAYQGWIAEDATFDTLLTAGFELARNEQPSTSAFFGDQIRTTNVGGSVTATRQFRSGGSASLIFRADRLDTTQLLTDINPSWTNTITGEIRHPLLRGQGTVVQTELRKAANNIAAAQAGFEAQAEQTLVTVAEAYWELAFAQRNLESLRKSESVAAKLLEDVQSRERAGVATPLDTAQARAGLKRRSSDRLAADGARRDTSDRLLALIRPFSACELSETEIIAIDDLMLADDRVGLHTQNELIRMGVRGRPEIRALRADIANRGLDQVAARDSIRPQLDLVGRVGSTGLRGDAGDSLIDMATGENIIASLGVEFSVFLGQRAAKARWRAAGWARRQTVLRLREQENVIVLDVRLALRSLRTAEAVLAASQEEVNAAQETLDGELLRLAEGKSTPFRVLELEDDLSLARTRVARAAANARRAEARVWRSVGSLTQRHGGRLPRFPACVRCR